MRIAALTRRVRVGGFVVAAPAACAPKPLALIRLVPFVNGTGVVLAGLILPPSAFIPKIYRVPGVNADNFDQASATSPRLDSPARN